MLSIDTNLLLYAYSKDSPQHESALAFLLEVSDREDVALSEFVLMEFYQLLRNPAVLKEPLSPDKAVQVIHHYRRHDRWRILGFPPDSKAFHTTLWEYAARPETSRRALFDARIALALRAFTVDEFATANTKDFQDFGFKRVWNPLEGAN
ncbi:MAG: TA system VapC family ribonuclease toxin [Opitutales bacterium]